MFAGQTQVAHASSRGFDKVPLELFYFSWFLILLDVKSKGFWSKIGLILSSNPFKVFESSCLKNMSHWGGRSEKCHILFEWHRSSVRFRLKSTKQCAVLRVDFINNLCSAFTRVGPKSAKRQDTSDFTFFFWDLCS